VKGTVEVEVSYAITSLSPDEANAERLLVFVRDHWTIENQLHSVRDVTLGADACRVRTGAGPPVLAALRNAVVHLLAGVPADSNPAAIEHLQVNPDQAKTLLGVPQTRYRNGPGCHPTCPSAVGGERGSVPPSSPPRQPPASAPPRIGVSPCPVVSSPCWSPSASRPPRRPKG